MTRGGDLGRIMFRGIHSGIYFDVGNCQSFLVVVRRRDLGCDTFQSKFDVSTGKFTITITYRYEPYISEISSGLGWS